MVPERYQALLSSIDLWELVQYSEKNDTSPRDVRRSAYHTGYILESRIAQRLYDKGVDVHVCLQHLECTGSTIKL